MSNWILRYPMKKQRLIGDHVLLATISPSLSQKPANIREHHSKELIKDCQDLQRHHDTSTPHRSETNGVAESALLRVTQVTLVAVVPSGLPGDWWDCAIRCYC